MKTPKQRAIEAAQLSDDQVFVLNRVLSEVRESGQSAHPTVNQRTAHQLVGMATSAAAERLPGLNPATAQLIVNAYTDALDALES